ncbi:MAG TPA: homogentisate 1,2-dioxygenase [Acidimicrobiales bacterium]
MSSLPPQWVKGRASRQAHADLPTGTVEEEHGREGFAGAASHLYRLHPPTGWTAISGPLRPMALDANRLDDPGDGTPSVLLVNDDLRIGWWTRPATDATWFFRDADGDVLYLVHEGEGRLATEYGPLAYRPGDYLLVPRSTTHRFEPVSTTRLLTIEALGGTIGLPDRGLLGRHALFDPAVVEVPEPVAHDDKGDYRVRVLREGVVSEIRYPFHPLDVVGWKGDLAPLRLAAGDFRPVVSERYHLPPSAHTTFVGNGFVVATFAPRPLERDPATLSVPFYHRNVDVDEVIFYHRGEFFSRAGISAGMLTFHPHGVHHGPQPAAVRRAEERGPGGYADEIAVNVDARRPLHTTPVAEAITVEGYEQSWQATS